MKAISAVLHEIRLKNAPTMLAIALTSTIWHAPVRAQDFTSENVLKTQETPAGRMVRQHGTAFHLGWRPRVPDCWRPP
jgi:hypothetical protein